MEILILVIISLINGLFSMSEAGVIATRRARLQQLADRGNQNAEAALKLVDNPNQFLSTVQIFITLIGIISGYFGGAAISSQIADLLRGTFLAPYATTLGSVLVILLTTYLSLILGELVPKRLALRAPERIAVLIAPFMAFLSRLTAPLVWFLGVSTEAVLYVLGARNTQEAPVTEEEIKTMIQQGVEAGVFEESEHDLVAGIFRFGDARVSSLMTPRTDVIWLDVTDKDGKNRSTIRNHDYSRFPVCDETLDHVLGIVETKDILSAMLDGKRFDIRKAVKPAIFVPQNLNASELLDKFRTSSTHLAVVLDEYGSLAGIITMQDILEAIVGDVEGESETLLEDGTYIFEGLMAIDEVKDMLYLDDLPGEHERYETVNGFMMFLLGKLPEVNDAVEWAGYQFKVLAIEGRRIDRLAVTRITENTVDEASRATSLPDEANFGGTSENLTE